MVRVNLSDATLVECDLRNSDLSFANLRGANLRGSNLEGVRINGSHLFNVDLSFCVLSNIDFQVMCSSSNQDWGWDESIRIRARFWIRIRARRIWYLFRRLFMKRIWDKQIYLILHLDAFHGVICKLMISIFPMLFLRMVKILQVQYFFQIKIWIQIRDLNSD